MVGDSSSPGMIQLDLTKWWRDIQPFLRHSTSKIEPSFTNFNIKPSVKSKQRKIEKKKKPVVGNFRPVLKYYEVVQTMMNITCTTATKKVLYRNSCFIMHTYMHACACIHSYFIAYILCHHHNDNHYHGFIAIAVVKYSQQLKRSFLKCVICNCGQVVASKHPKKKKTNDMIYQKRWACVKELSSVRNL